MSLRLTQPSICKGVDSAARAKLLRVANLATHLVSRAAVTVRLPAHRSAGLVCWWVSDGLGRHIPGRTMRDDTLR